MKKTSIKYSVVIFLSLLSAGCGEAAEPTLLEEWGLGREESEYISLNRDYDWYIDQFELQLGHQYNDGPACAVMAAKWADADFSKTLGDAREVYMNNSFGYIGRWRFDNIYNFLNDNDIPCQINYNISLPNMREHLDNGNIMIVYITTWSIPQNTNEGQRTGKYYSSFNGRRINLTAARAASRHFIIIKGYRVVDGKTYFEVYDPFGAWRYADGTPKGQDRYYLANDVIDGVEGVDQYYGAEEVDHYLVISAKDKPLK